MKKDTSKDTTTSRAKAEELQNIKNSLITTDKHLQADKPVKIFQLAKQLNISHKDIIEYLKSKNIAASINKALEPEILVTVLEHFAKDVKKASSKVKDPQLVRTELPKKFKNNSLITEDKHLLIERINDSIVESSDNISAVSKKMKVLREQGVFTKHTNVVNNINMLADSTDKLSSVQKSSLDLIVLLLGAVGKMKSNYNDIFKLIDSEREKYRNEIVVLDFLKKIKNTIKDMKNRDSLLESLITFTNDLRNSIIEMDKNLQNKMININKKIEQSTEKILFIEENLEEQIEKVNKSNSIPLMWIGLAIAIVTSITSLILIII